MKEQIEQLENDITECYGCDPMYYGTDGNFLAKGLVEMGWRKQSENTVEVVRCAECQESEVCPDTLLWCNEWDRLVPPKGFCHCGAKMKGGAE